MKLCILLKEIDSKPLYCSGDDTYYYLLYHIPIAVYKKQVLKGNVCTDLIVCARVCVMYAREVLEGRFELGEDIISKDGYHSNMYAREVLKGRFGLAESNKKTGI